jgi:hypothetical protein
LGDGLEHVLRFAFVVARRCARFIGSARAIISVVAAGAAVGIVIGCTPSIASTATTPAIRAIVASSW